MKYRPVEGRRIEEVKAGDFVCVTEFNTPYRVAHLEDVYVWLRRGNESSGLTTSLYRLNEEHWRIFEPIPEPNIEVRNVRIYIAEPDAPIGLDGWCELNVTRTDGKITAVELVKDES